MKNELIEVLSTIFAIIIVVAALLILSFYIAKAFMVGNSPLDNPWIWIGVFSGLTYLLLSAMGKSELDKRPWI